MFQEFRVAARRGPSLERLAPIVSTKLTEDERRQMTRSETVFMIRRNPRLQGRTWKGCGVFSASAPIRSPTSYAHPDGPAHAASRVSDPMILDPRLGQARTLCPHEWALLKGLPLTMARHLEALADTGTYGEYIAMRLIANCIEVHAWTAILHNVLAAVIVADSNALEQSRRRLAARERLARDPEDTVRAHAVRETDDMNPANWRRAQTQDPWCCARIAACELREANQGEDADLSRGHVDTRGFVLADGLLRYSAMEANYGIRASDVNLPRELRIVDATDRSYNYRLCVPHIWRLRLVDSTHVANLHLRHQRLLEVLKREFFWPGMGNLIEDRTRVCRTCQFALRRHLVNAGTLTMNSARGAFMDALAIDWVSVDQHDQLETGSTGFMSVIDLATSYVWAFPAENHLADTMARKLLGVFNVHGVPLTLLSDNGSEFVNATWAALLAMLGSPRRITNTPHHPQGNGRIEVWHRWVLERLRSTVSESHRPSEWPILLQAAVQVYNHSRTSTSPYPPYEQAFGRSARNALLTQSGLSAVVGMPSSHRGVGTVVEELRLTAEYMRESAHLATNLTRERAARGSRRYDVAYQVGDLVLVVDEANPAYDAAVGYTPRKLVSPMKGAVYQVTELLANGNVRIRAQQRARSTPVEISLSKLRRFVNFSRGQMSAEDPSGFTEARIGDFLLVELAVPDSARTHMPRLMRLMSTKGSELLLQLFQNNVGKRPLEPPILPVWMKKRTQGKRFNNVQYTSTPDPTWVPYHAEAKIGDLVSDPFMDLTDDGRVPREAMEQAQTRMTYKDLPQWEALLASCRPGSHLLRKW